MIKHVQYSSCWLQIALVVVVAFAAAVICRADEALPTPAALAAHLRHQEQLVRTMECTYEYKKEPTATEAIRQLRQLETRQPGRGLPFVISPEIARSHSYTAKWERSGVKERSDVARQFEGVSSSESMAFDGTVVRQVSHVPTGKPQASIVHPERSHYRNSLRESPFHVLFEYVNKPFSEVVISAKHASVSPAPDKGKGHIRLALETEPWALELVFDEPRRLIEWSIRATGQKSPTQICQLQDYRAYSDSSGETIWFPDRATIRHLVPASADEPAIEWAIASLTFASVRFNTDIPDSRFVLALPADAEVYDDVTGQGYLPAIQLQDTWSDPPKPAVNWQSWWWGLVIGTLVVLGLLGWGIFRWHRTAPQPPSDGGSI